MGTEEHADPSKDFKKKVLLHPGPFVMPRNGIRKLACDTRTTTGKVVKEMRALQELGHGTLRCRGAVQKDFLKALPTKQSTSC